MIEHAQKERNARNKRMDSSVKIFLRKKKEKNVANRTSMFNKKRVVKQRQNKNNFNIIYLKRTTQEFVKHAKASSNKTVK